VSISRITPRGTEADPFYGEHCSGLLIYDATGWVSVQIVAESRPQMPTPEARGSNVVRGAAPSAHEEGALLETYYAYFGTWRYDAGGGTVTHTISASLYPAEQGLAYTQEVALQGANMIFTVRTPSAQGEIRQVKIWERVKPAA
jgi:hypothetical protein